MKKILTLLLPVIALAAGTFGGAILHPATGPDDTTGHEDQAADAHATPEAEDYQETEPKHAAADNGHGGGDHMGDHGGDSGAAAWFTFPTQFFVPMMRNGDMGAMMILTLSIETTEGALEPMKQQEHRLRDALLRQLLILANTGGFDGNFTADARIRVLREGLLKAARAATDLPVDKVLIEDIARQAGS